MSQLPCRLPATNNALALESDHTTDHNEFDILASIMQLQQIPFIESLAVPQNYINPDVSIEQLLQQQNVALQITFPRIAAPPINMFQPLQLEEHAFPVLYSKGKIGMGYDRNKPIMTSRIFNPDYSIKTPGGEIMYHRCSRHLIHLK